jgi:hypothetical protein
MIERTLNLHTNTNMPFPDGYLQLLTAHHLHGQIRQNKAVTWIHLIAETITIMSWASRTGIVELVDRG